MARLKNRRSLVFAARLRKPDVLISEPTEQDETDHQIEEWIGEALPSRDE